MIPLSAQIIQHDLSTPTAQAIPIEIVRVTTSTIDHLKSLTACPLLCLAEEQTQARGQHQRVWYAPAFQNIYFSLRWQFPQSFTQRQGLSLAVGLAVIQALTQHGAPALKIKWPNDIYWRNQKLAGILIELGPHQIATISMGINVNMTSAETIPQSWTSLQLITGKAIDRNPLIASLLEQLIATLNQYQQSGWQSFLPLWAQYDYLKDQRITLQQGDNRYQGRVNGVDHRGYLLLEDDLGNISHHINGHVVKA
ncbi:MAG: biotin--[acetyl-CoA-carboxylase] ligase [Gammaproteobacteria bacterium]